MPPNQVRAKPEQAMGWALLFLLLLGCLLVLRPFVSALLWALVLCFSSWPIYRRLTAALGQRRTLAAGVMGLGMVLILLLPLVIVGSTLADNVKDLTTAARRSFEKGPPAPPAWLLKVPVIGQSATDHWQSLANDSARLWSDARRLIEPVSSWLLKLGLLIAGGLMELGLSILIAFFLFRDGLFLAERLTTAVDRIGGERGRHLLGVAGNTIRGVVYGILGTALVQAILTGIGFLVAGVPGAGVLALLTFFISVVPLMGPALVWLPAAIWLFYQGSTGWGIFLAIWGLGVNGLEHVIKPFLISKGSDMPFLLIFFGVLGGAMAFGFIGVFLGPTLLAVGYRVVSEWGAATRLAAQAPEASARDPKAGLAAGTLGGNGGESER
jgi:predicted PurR-regulated permease PerM